MIQQIPLVPEIPESEVTPLVKSLLQIIQCQVALLIQTKEEIQKLKDEIAVLKKGNKKPQVPPSSLEKPPPNPNNGKRPGSEKKNKTCDLIIHNTQRIPPTELPENAIFKDLHSYVVQDLLITN